MSREVLYFDKEPRGRLYRSLIEWLVPRAEEFLLVVRDPPASGGEVERALAMLRNWRSCVENVSEWPGTKIVGSATLYRHVCRPSPVSILCELSEALFDWQHPALPEDLCFVAPSGRVLLASIAHEHEAYLDLSLDERSELMAAIPDLISTLVEHRLPQGW